MLNKMRNSKGFTLIEMMIVVAIIGILAAVAIPRFIRFAVKSRQSEAKINLATFYEAEEGYFGEFNAYTSDLGLVAFTPSGVLQFYSLTHTADDTSFSMTATGNIDDDTTDDTWYVDNDGRDPTCAVNDVTAN